MNHLIRIVLIAVGVVLIVMGLQASEAFASDVSKFFTGSPTDRSIWLVLGGVIALAAGMIGVQRRKAVN